MSETPPVIMHRDTAPAPSGDMGVFGALTLGLTVLGSELKWLAVKGVRSFELRQLRRRLDEEYALLGRLTAELAAAGESASQGHEDVRLALGQIDFLREEIARLEDERRLSRDAFVNERRRRLNLDNDATMPGEAP